MTLIIRPLTPDLWPALEGLFGDNRACKDCKCMYSRMASASRTRAREQDKEGFVYHAGRSGTCSQKTH